MSLELHDDLRDESAAWDRGPAVVRAARVWRPARQAAVRPERGEFGRSTLHRNDFHRNDFRRNEFRNWTGEPVRRPALSSPGAPPRIPQTAVPPTLPSSPVPPGWLFRCWSRLCGAGLTGAAAMTSYFRTGQDRASSRTEW